ncbi:MAG: hypothetical protein M0Q21_02480 [Ignavibacteriaceae bacterium]|nr:hypothetical protein [Ignavibacteriaceae bacterium]
MEKTVRVAIFLVVILFMFSCNDKRSERVVVNVTSLIKKLSANDFYKDFFNYNIRSRTPGTYQIETDSVLEFEVDFDMDDGISLIPAREAFLDEKLKSSYSNKYIEIKKTYLFDLNKLISFIDLYGIKGVVHFSPQRIDFFLADETLLRRYDNSILNMGVESAERFWDSVKVIDSNWVLLKHRKLP